MSVNLGRVAFVAKGSYNAATTYQQYDYVTHNNGSYVYISPIPAAGKPVTDAGYWQPLIDPAGMNNATAAANTAATNAETNAQTAATAAETANTAAAAADEARQNIQSDLAGKAPAIFVDASGKIVTVTDGAAMPVQRLVTHIEPVQEGEGDPPINGRDKVEIKVTGKNILPGGEAEQAASFVLYDTHEAFKGLEGQEITVSFDLFSPDGKPVYVYAYQNSGLSIKDSHVCFPSAGVYKRDYHQTSVFRHAETINNGQLAFYQPDNEPFMVKNVQVELGTTATDYVPYQGQTLTADLPETVYGGTLDWGTGVLTSTLDVDGNELTQPKVFQLTPKQISTLKGTNNVWSDAGETEVTYAVDTKLYIDGKIAAIAAAIV